MWLAASLLQAASPRAQTTQQPPIPFVRAAVSSADNQHFNISWQAPGVAHIRILAGTDPAAIDNARTVADGPGAGRRTVSDLNPAPRWYFDLVPNRGASLVIADRSVHLSNATNFRDVGGYRTRAGQWVRMGLLYRSNALDHLAAPDLAALTALHLKWICDLRTTGERRHGPDIVPPGVPDEMEDVLADDTGKLRAILAAAPVAGKPGPDPTAAAHDLYRDFVVTRSARLAYHALFLHLADPAQLPAVFHCSAGKDRTGWAAAILLTILDVPRPVIVQDYLLTNTYLHGADADRLRKAAGANSIASRLALTADPSDLQAAFTAVQQSYGSFDRYLHDGLGLSDATLDALRRNFLAG
jgi:protein-tyrosine phosphatase